MKMIWGKIDIQIQLQQSILAVLVDLKMIHEYVININAEDIFTSLKD